MSGILERLTNPNALGGSLAFQTDRPLEWLFVLASLGLLLGGALYYNSRGPGRGLSARRLAAGLEAGSGVAGWAMAGVLVCIWALTTAFIGFVWDVAWHADTGRDVELFTVPHTLILMGLMGLVLSAAVAIVLANAEGAAVGLEWRGRRVPYSSIPMLLVGLGAVSGFPLDDFWHATYGIDVTMWSPTHLLMIGGASLSPLAMWLMLREAGVGRHGPARWRWLTMGGVVLIGLSTFQLEYDMGILQWQVLFQPALIAAAAGIALITSRIAIGRGGALVAAGGFLFLRILMALLVGGLLQHTLPRFPLYLGEALCVEAAFLALARAPIIWRGLAAGALIGTVGLATEWAWTQVAFVYPWQAGLLPYLWIAVGAALAAALVGVAAGQALAGERVEVPAAVVGAALVTLALLVGFHLPLRSGAPGHVTVSSHAVGPARLVVNRYGVPSTSQAVSVDVTVDPPELAPGADRWDVIAWQGGPPVKHFRLVPAGPGRYHAEGLVPTGGNWKSLVFLMRGDQVAAAPVAMTADPAYGLAEIPPPDQRTSDLAPASRYLMREFRGDVLWPAYLIIAMFTVAIAAWGTSLALAYRAVVDTVAVRLEAAPAELRRRRIRPEVI